MADDVTIDGETYDDESYDDETIDGATGLAERASGTVANLAQFEGLVLARRTSLSVDPDRPIADAVVERLIRLATWAPSHKRTYPWRFAWVTGAGRHRLGAVISTYEASIGATASRVERARTKYARAPVVLLVGIAHHRDPVRRQEDRDAAAAGVEHVLLGATAAGLASHWATGTWMDDPEVKHLAGLAPDDQLVALIYLGWPVAEVVAPQRPTPVVTRIDS